MSWFSGWRRGSSARSSTRPEPSAVAHLEQFVASRRGVEAFIEQPTTMTKASILLIAYDGEWTRRTVPDVAWARRFAARSGLPAYDAGVIGYPQRMRDYDSRRRPKR